jgi:16S rRNA (guanine966-N2)-methyltransferase
MRIIAGEARGRKLLGPGGAPARPPLDRLRESVFSILDGAFEGRGVLDLFAGVGSFGLEAVSRGAARAVFVEENRSALELLRRNIGNLGFAARAEVIQGDALKVPDLAERPPGSFALVFLDAPFVMATDPVEAERLYRRAQEIAASPALDPGGTVVLRLPSRSRAPETLTVVSARAYGGSAVYFLSPARAVAGS